MTKLRVPSCEWLKAPELDGLILGSTVLKEMIKVDNTSNNTQRLCWKQRHLWPQL